jgi:predicted nucleic acid-binding protein
MRYLLDSNVISNATKLVPSPLLIAWMSQQANENLFIASIGIAEVWRGILEMPSGRKRRGLEEWFQGSEGPPALFAGRVLSFTEEAGCIWARLMSDGTRSGRPRSALDMILAAIAEANDCTLVTDNEKHFAGVKLINPMRATHERP